MFASPAKQTWLHTSSNDPTQNHQPEPQRATNPRATLPNSHSKSSHRKTTRELRQDQFVKLSQTMETIEKKYRQASSQRNISKIDSKNIPNSKLGISVFACVRPPLSSCDFASMGMILRSDQWVGWGRDQYNMVARDVDASTDMGPMQTCDIVWHVKGALRHHIYKQGLRKGNVACHLECYC